jgi:hypothetical protein
MRNRARLTPLALVIPALGWLACQQAPPVVQVQAPPCECACAFKASAPQVGKGCWVSGDLMVCPLVRRDLEIEPAYPSDDPRCERLPDGDLRCAIHSGDPPPSAATPAPGPEPDL